MTRNPSAGGRKRPGLVPLLLFVAILLFTGGRGPAAEQRPAVLVLHSYHMGLGWTDSITRGIESVLNNSPLNPEIHYEHMDAKRVSDPAYFRNLYALYKHKYRNKTFDAIISSDDHAFRFLLKYHQELFPETPVVFCGINYFQDDMLAGVRSYFTGVVESLSIRGTIDVALRIQPDARYVFVVTDGSITGQANKNLLMEIIPDYKGRLEFIFFDSMEMTAVQDRVSRLPEHSFVLWLTFTTDPAGYRYSLEEGCRLVSEHCAAPLYGFWDFILGNGAVGGLLASGFAHGEMAARMAKRILQGEEAGHLPVIKESPNRYMFDYRQMKRYGLDIGRLPPDSILLNAPKSFYAVNKEWIWAMVGIIVGLIAMVCFLGDYIHLRRTSERTLKKSEERFRGLFNNAQVGLVRAEVIAIVCAMWLTGASSKTSTPKGPLQLAVPASVSAYWFPNLFPQDVLRPDVGLGAEMIPQPRNPANP